MTPAQEKQFVRMHEALKRITCYQSPSHMRKHSIKEWGLPFEEVLEIAYENVQEEAKQAVKGIRVPHGK